MSRGRAPWRRFAAAGAACLLASACSTSGGGFSLNPFGGGQPRLSSEQKCTSQGYREGSDIYGECVAFYDRQTFANRRNVAIAIGVAAIGLVAFQSQCDCLFGPDRGDKFTR